MVLLVVVGVLFARDVGAVRDALLAAEGHLIDAQEALAAADLERATISLEDADQELSDARSRSRAPLWNLAASLPGVRGSVEVVRGVVDVASATTAVGEDAVGSGGALLEAGLDIEVDDGVVDLAPLVEAADVLGSLPTNRLEDAYDRLRQTRPTWVPQELADARASTLEQAGDVISTVRNGEALLTVLPAYLGEDGPRRYFLGVQTSAELRGTGGLIGFYAVLTVDEGSFELGTVDVYEGLDDANDEDRVLTESISELSGDAEAGVDASPGFEFRYGHTDATGLFSNVNVDPDLPTTARVALDLYEARTGEVLDGVVLLDAIGMQTILEATGAELELPADAVEGTQVPASLPASDFAEFVTIDVYDQFGHDRSAERKALLSDLGESAFAQVFGGAWDGVAVGQALGRSAGGRHLQVFSEVEEEQRSFEVVGAAGDFLEREAGDRLAVTVNNAVGGKQDVHVGHRFEVETELRAPHRGDAPDEAVVLRRSRIRSELHNPLAPTSYDTYIVGNCLVDEAVNQCFDGPPAHNRSWFSVWTPGDDRLQAARNEEGSIGLVAGDMHGLRVFDRYLETPPESSRWFELEVDGPVTMTLDGTELVYEFTWWRQAKGVPDVLDLRIDAPGGWEVVDSQMIGGDSGLPLLGIDRDVAPVELSADRSGVSLHGAVSRDVTVQMRLGRS